MKKIINKGSKAGGSKTNFFGKQFELQTSMKENLIKSEFNEIKIGKGKFDFYLEKKIDDKKIIYVTQTGMKKYFKTKYNIDMFRYPDEAYIIEMKDKCIVKILEKKEQHVNGSVETKLWAGSSLKREYEIVLGDKFIVEYSYCVNKFLSSKINSDVKKYKILKQILNESKINIFEYSDSNYYTDLEKWINTI
jgi:hypothetical protein